MKKLLPLLIIATLVLTNCCKDDDDPGNFQTPLPAATQTGAGTFACYINGKAFIDTSGNFNCYYQISKGKYYFNVKGQHDFEDWSLAMNIGSYGVPFEKGKTYPLTDNKEDNVWGGVRFEPIGKMASEFASTTNKNPGTLTITNFDMEKQIVSGTFSFTLIHPFTKETVKITNGRFDSLFTK